MKPNPNLDELLSSFMDGELSPRQRTEVQRMAAHDPAVARRLRQLQNCRTLFCSLPPAEAPGDMLEQIRQSLERKTLLQEQPVVGPTLRGGDPSGVPQVRGGRGHDRAAGGPGSGRLPGCGARSEYGIAAAWLWTRIRLSLCRAIWGGRHRRSDGCRCRFLRPAGAADGDVRLGGCVRQAGDRHLRPGECGRG